jgi:putative lipoprotein
VNNGIAEVLAMETMSAMPIEDKVAMSMGLISRKGINSIRTAVGLIIIFRQAAPQTFAYDCRGGYSFTARAKERKVWLFLPNKTISLPLVSAGSGAKYSEGQIAFWRKGHEAMLEVGDKRYANCNNNRAKAIWEDAKFRGVDFRAVGNGPGWYLELKAGEKIVFVSDYGNTKYAFDTSEPLVDQHARTTSYKVQGARHDLAIRIEGRPCRDSMSGEPFDTTVTVILNGKKYRGCGKALH